MANGTAHRVPNDARENLALVVDRALEVWNARQKTADETGRKLQQGAFSIQTEDGKTRWLVRPRRTGLEFYTHEPNMDVTFKTTTTVSVERPKLDKPKTAKKKTTRRKKKTSK